MPVLPFGRYRGREPSQVTDRDYLVWFLRTVDIRDPDLREAIADVVESGAATAEPAYRSQNPVVTIDKPPGSVGPPILCFTCRMFEYAVRCDKCQTYVCVTCRRTVEKGFRDVEDIGTVTRGVFFSVELCPECVRQRGGWWLKVGGTDDGDLRG